MGQEEYRSCMAKNMGGGRLKGLSKEDRRIEFCTIAKECSKGISYKEARPICIEAAANPKAPRKTRRGKSRLNFTTLAGCIIDSLDGSEATRANLVPIIASCTGAEGGKE